MSEFDPPDPSLRAGADADPSPDAPSLIGVSFESATRAQEFLIAMTGLRNDGALQLKDAVIVTKADDGKVNVVETIDPTPGRAAASGAVWTGLLGLVLGGPIGWLAGMGVGAGVGAVTAKVVDVGVPDEWVDWFKQAVANGTTTVVVLAEQLHVRALADEAKRFVGAELLYASLPASSVEQLVDAFDPQD